MDSKYRYLVKNTSILTISNFSSKILVFLLVPLYTSVLSTSEYGTYDLIATTLQLLTPFLALNIYEGVMRFMMDDSAEKKDVASIGLKYVLIGILLFGIIICVNKALYLWPALADYSLYVFSYFSFGLFYQYVNQFAKGLEKVTDMGIAGVLGTLATVILNILLLLGLHMGLPGFYIAYIAGQGIPAVYLSLRIKVWRYIIARPDKKTEHDMIWYSLPLIMNSLGWWANNVSDRYVVTFICGVAVNGIYSVAYKIPTILNTLQQIFVQAWQISAIKEYSNDDSRSFYGKALDYMNVIMCICCMGLILLTKPIAHILYAKDFYAAWRHVPFLLVSGVFNSASGILGPILTANKNSKAMGSSALYGALINIVLNIVLVLAMGAQGAAIATAVSSFFIYFFRKISVGKDITYLNRKQMIISWLLICIQAALAIYTSLYIVQAFIIILLMIMYRNEIKGLWKFALQFVKRR